MDATTMPKINSLVKSLQAAFPHLNFQEADDFRWTPETTTVYYRTDGEGIDELLHETAHGLLEHSNYENDIDLLKIERDAWSYAQKELAPRFKTQITDENIEDALDSYRDWLHARSRCPHCTQTGIQTGAKTYKCLVCNESWHTNEARRCALRRYKLSHTKTPAL